MSEDEVVYTAVKFAKGREKANLKTKSSEAKTQKTSTDSPGPRSKVTAERAALLVLVVLLMAAVGGLSVSLITCASTKRDLESLRILSEAQKKNFTETLSRLKLSSTVAPTCPKPPAVTPSQECKYCESGWNENAGWCYFFSTDKLNWTASREKCQTGGGNLVKVNDWDEQKFLESTLKTKMEEAEDKFWIGLTDSKKEDKWLWTDNSILDSGLAFWSNGEPDNWTGKNGQQPDGEDCVRMGEKRGAADLKCWFDRSCMEPHKFICEKAATRGVLQRVCVSRLAA